MKLPRFKYLRPENLENLCDSLAETLETTAILAGGTDLLIRLKQGLATPSRVVSLGGVTELQGIEVRQDVKGLRVGAGVTLAQLTNNPIVRQLVPGLSEAASLVGARQHQVMGTIGGNLALETRCWYYNQSAQWRKTVGPCFKLGGEKCHVAPNNENCSAAFSGDTAPILLALDAEVKLMGRGKERVICLREFYTGQGERPNCLEPGEFLAEVYIPNLPDSSFARYLKLRNRDSIEFPQAGVAVKYRLDGKVIHEVRIVVNAMAPAPFRVSGAEKLLEGNLLTEELVNTAAELVLAATRPVLTMPGSTWHRRITVQKFTRELLPAMAGDMI